ncbi:hypothetical protein PMZ80_003767 [Knufia obscura]|uniref:Uncharacterized protein n=1 Tax=Knufia obscura TaxID=1635080 RepID=A0ABR0RV67_9EURO|nr:hypothetical protein PMZ80_003767 [Knufia obscura]
MDALCAKVDRLEVTRDQSGPLVVFKQTVDGPALRMKPKWICYCVEALFAHAFIAEMVSDEDLELQLVVVQQDTVIVARGDSAGFERVVKAAGALGEITVLPVVEG